MFVLPTFYKKFRFRVLLKKRTFLAALLSARDVISGVLLRIEFIVELHAALALAVRRTSQIFLGNFTRRVSVVNLEQPRTTPLLVDASIDQYPHIHLLDPSLYDVSHQFNVNSDEGVSFTKYIKL